MEQYDKNEPIGCRMAQEILPDFDYSTDLIEKICKCIMATQLPQDPKGYLPAMIVCDADLGHLGTELFFLRSEFLRLELSKQFNKPITLRSWNTGNIQFLKNHKYWTKSAIEKFDPIKKQNLNATLELLGMETESQEY